MRKYLLAAAATAALSCFAAPAMAQQCGGDQELTMNPDGTTTCGDQFTSPLMQGADFEIILPEEPFVGYDLSTAEEVSITENEDSYEVTLVLQEQTDFTSSGGQAQTVTTTVMKDTGQITSTANYGGNVRVTVFGRGANFTVGGTVTRTGPRTVTTTTTTTTTTRAGGGTIIKVPPKTQQK